MRQTLMWNRLIIKLRALIITLLMNNILRFFTSKLAYRCRGMPSEASFSWTEITFLNPFFFHHISLLVVTKLYIHSNLLLIEIHEMRQEYIQYRYTIWSKFCTWPSHPYVHKHSRFIPPIAVIITSTLMWRLYTSCWSVASGICAHSSTRALASSVLEIPFLCPAFQG